MNSELIPQGIEQTSGISIQIIGNSKDSMFETNLKLQIIDKIVQSKPDFLPNAILKTLCRLK